MYESTMPPAGVRTSDALCDWGADCGIGIYDRPLSGADALCVCGGGLEAVAVDGRRLRTEADRRCALAHELGHLRTGALYTEFSSPADVRRAEYRADVWAAQTLIPRDKLLSVLVDGATELWQIAEHFSVTEKLAAFAMNIYGLAN